MDLFQYVAYGAGTNSTAMLVGLRGFREQVDAIVFADTGGEKPHTYQHLKEVSAWCLQVGLPPVTIVKGDLPQQVADGTLEQECLRLNILPSKAYGFGTCSQKWKIAPSNKWLSKQAIEGKHVVKCIGFDVDEVARIQRAPKVDPQTGATIRMPLVEWEWDREACIKVIEAAGLPLPGKSACFFCPSSKKPEIVELAEQYPDLLARAIRMEQNATKNVSVKGLGRSFNWGDFIASLPTSAEASAAGVPEIDCGCYDG